MQASEDVAGYALVRDEGVTALKKKDATRWLPRAAGLLLLAALAGCTDNAFYVRSDAAVGLPAELAGLDTATLAAHPLEVVVTFKSDGLVLIDASDALFDSIAASLRTRGIRNLRRFGLPGSDVSPDIAALKTAAAAPASAAPKDEDEFAVPAAPRSERPPRLLVLVENHPDLSGGTRAEYFGSGFTLGAWSLNKPTDRYDITMAYRDPHGQAHVYRSHQDLIFSTGSSVFGRDQEAVAGLRRYEDPLAAFGGVVANSVNGGPGVITVGKPQFDTPGSAAPTPAAANP